MSRQGRIAAALTALSGLLLALAFPGVDAGWLGWIALVPLLIAVSHRTPRDAFLLGCLAGFLAFAIILSWMRLFGIVPWLLLAGYLALYVGAFAGLYRWLSEGRPAIWTLWLIPVLWTALEYLRSIGVFGFPWALLGVSQHAAIPVLQVARVTGVYGVSFLVALGNAGLAGLLLTRRPRALFAPVLVIGGLLVWGAITAPLPAPGALRIAALQPNVAATLKFDPGAAAANMHRLQTLVEQAAATPADLIVMPETALPSDLFGDRGLLGEVATWAQRAAATVIATSLEHGVSNVAVAVAPSGMAVSRYDKGRLVAFAEAGIRPGSSHDPLWTPVGWIGVAICFESIFPEVSRDLVRGGAQLLAVLSNDAWSDGTAGPAQHARFAPLRAVEMSRWVVHATNSGISQIVDPAGRVVAALPVGQVAVLAGRADLSDIQTIYARWGDWFAQLTVVAVLAAAVMLRRRELLWEARSPAFRTAAAISLLPLISAVALLRAGAPWWLWAGAVFLFVVIFAGGRFRGAAPVGVWSGWRGPAAATMIGSAVVVALWGIIVVAFRAQQIPVGFGPPPSGWPAAAFTALLTALALEAWLRGQAFSALLSWRGTSVAVAGTTLMAMILQTGLPAEAMAWAMVTGIAFGLIRARTGSALGLVIPHALGNLLIGFLTVVR